MEFEGKGDVVVESKLIGKMFIGLDTVSESVEINS
jgi:hypothetical protein